ncbi:hypothetical protein ACQP2E_10395 [Actinoplanes sp. CA-015351]|uniref:hypothetical protein n=1 Tax=Actinoplanes sp. CA-015351 TaxID=3239897 RepID=UPI003D97451B
MLLAELALAGTLGFTPAASIDTAAIVMTTSAGCPAPADSFHAVARGHGFPADGQIVTAPTAAGLSRTSAFDVYFAQTMKDFAADNHTTTLAPGVETPGNTGWIAAGIATVLLSFEAGRRFGRRRP